TTVEALAAVLGGTQSLHTNSLDEAIALPTDFSAKIARDTQIYLQKKAGITKWIDPLGGSYYVETLTNEMEAAAYDYFRRIDELGGIVESIKRGFPQREIADAAFRYQREVDAGERIVVGVNKYELDDEEQMEILRIAPELERKQIGRVQAVKATRSVPEVEASLKALREAAATDQNLLYPILDCARVMASEGEIVHALQDVFGTYREVPVF
ncbi:MAG: methylmalonyl-CoA mutase family protein, partial [Solirubrobacterales bacterium]